MFFRTLRSLDFISTDVGQYIRGRNVYQSARYQFREPQLTVRGPQALI
jgi:hypothetical protein